jgi:endonuclease/exonuclease/phosphatase family metal-dependent hydrolase
MKLLQWNVWYQEDIRNIVKVLKDINADVICLQELTVNDSINGIDTAAYLAHELTLEYFYKDAQEFTKDSKTYSFGNGIFSRYPISNSMFVYIQEPFKATDKMVDYSKEGRVYVETTIHAPDRTITVGTVHMSYTDRFLPTPEKKAETDALTAILKHKKDSFLLTGDFNALPDSYTIEEISKHLKHAGPPMDNKTWTTKPFAYQGFEAKTLDWRLDYCFATPDIDILSTRTIDTVYSDHLPIILEF